MGYNLEKPIYDYMDDSFWVDFIEDTINLNVDEYINSYIKNVKKVINIIQKQDCKHLSFEQFWTKIYQYKKIDYSKPITYKYFKETILSTHTLINLMHLQIDLYQSLSTIEKAFDFPLNQYFKVDVKKIFTDLILYRIDIDGGDATVEDAFVMINEKVGIKNPWGKNISLYKDYWFWLWILLVVSDACFDSLYQIKLESLNYNSKFINNMEYQDFEVLDLEEQKQQYNANTTKENSEWEQCRKVYHEASNQYRLVKLLVNSAYNNYTLDKILNNIENMSLDEQCCPLFQKAVKNLFPINEKWLNHFKNYLFDNCFWMYQLLFRQNNFNSIKQIYEYISNTKQKEAVIAILRFSFDIVQDKSNKTIVNNISEMECLISQNKAKGCPLKSINGTNEKIIDEYTIIKKMIEKTSWTFTLYLQTPNESNLLQLTQNLKALKKIPN